MWTRKVESLSNTAYRSDSSILPALYLTARWPGSHLRAVVLSIVTRHQVFQSVSGVLNLDVCGPIIIITLQYMTWPEHCHLQSCICVSSWHLVRAAAAMCVWWKLCAGCEAPARCGYIHRVLWNADIILPVFIYLLFHNKNNVMRC